MNDLKIVMIQLILIVFAGLILTLGWGVNFEQIGIVRFLVTWAIGAMILIVLIPYVDKYYE